MDTADVIQAISAGICLYAGLLHLVVGLRSQPRDRVHLTFAVLALLFGIVSVNLFVLYTALRSGSLDWYVFTDRWGIAVTYLGYVALFWFIAVYTGARQSIMLWGITSLYLLIALSNFLLPYPWVYTDIELTSTFPPDIVVAPWYSVEQVLTLLLLIAYPAYHAVRQYRRGERGAAAALGVALGIFLVTLLWDHGIEYGLIDTVLMSQYGFVAFIVIMSLRLADQYVEARKESHRLNVTLEQRVEERTAALSEARDAAEAANRAKSTFLANMSHELRTPLNVILGLAQIMRRDRGLSEQEAENVEIIHRSGEHLLELINDVLEVSRIEAGQSELNLSAFDLVRTLHSLEQMTRVRAEKKGLALAFERDPDVPRYIRTDERKLRQVLINLLGNAVKFTEAGGVTLRVKEVDRDQWAGEKADHYPRTTIHFEVEDTGEGIAPEEREALFEPFGQTSSGRRQGEGTGLGLAISRQFVQLMGGDIAVRSRAGEGTTVTFDIVVELVDLSEVQPKEPVRRVVGLVPEQAGSYRILIVDDNRDNRLMLCRLLAGVGFEVQEAGGGQEAIEAFDRWQPHLVWMDIRMPDVDGYEATRQIKATAQGQATPVIALTPSAFEEERAAVLAAGCDDFVRKPIRESEIFAKMGEHLGVRYVYEELAPPEEPAVPDLTPVDLADLPEAWLTDLRQAARRGRASELVDLIAQIEADHASLARALWVMVEDYQFRRIVALIEQVETT
jgi:signal transduction histidine kinase/ActR/RegA family two-component response regulator